MAIDTQRLEAIRERLAQLDRARDWLKALEESPKQFSLWERQFRAVIERSAEQDLKANAEADLRFLVDVLDKTNDD